MKATLKSASDFKPARTDAASDVSVAPVVPVGGQSALGALQLGAAKLTAAADPEPISVIPSTSQVVITPAAFAETAKVEVADPSSLGMAPAAPGVSGTAQTVPLISPTTVAAAIAMGPKRPVATTLPVLASPVSVSPAAPKPTPEPGPTLHEGKVTPYPGQPEQPMGATAPSAGFPMDAPLTAPPGQTAPIVLPQTPPVFPLGPVVEGPAPISGTRGLLIGFLAGAVLMGFIAIVYFVVVR
jgi:hypothetical protein